MLLGLKWRRYREWAAVVAQEGRSIKIYVLIRMVLSALAGGLVSRREWRARMRACMRCPIYDRARHACRDTYGRGTGCGCWMPIKAMFRGNQCWVREIEPDGPYGHP